MWVGFISNPTLCILRIFNPSKKKHVEEYRYSSAIDYVGGKGLLEVMVV